MRRRHDSAGPGFTLLEVVLAMSILALLTGSIYGLMRQSLQSGAELQLAEREDRSVYRFIDLCRDVFLTLPGEATLVCPLPEDAVKGQELVLTGVPDAFRVGEPVVSGESLTIGLQPYAMPSGEIPPVPVHVVALSREEFAPRVEEGQFATGVGSGDGFYAPDEEGRYWLPLLPSVERCTWRFWNVAEETWEEEWTDAASRPPLVELQVQPYGRGFPYRAVFEVPPMAEAEIVLPDLPAAGSGGGGGGAPGGGAGRPPGGGNQDGQGRPDGGGGPGGGRPGGPGGRPGPGEGRGPDGARPPGEGPGPSQGPRGPGQGQPGAGSGSGRPAPASPAGGGNGGGPSGQAR